ncbi:unnamed protein product [Blepharisma stoltei]|uniref:Receptor ligand binding region domain-containing protein n=1 Tax=Blepharisma stoltei TaxID=1481888 RepID=A0AAU9I8P5_9CILI|nr:unnamed protein product [Blepharisma stoltei]
MLIALLLAKICLTSQLTVGIVYSNFTDLDFASNLTALVKNNLEDELEVNLMYFDSLWDESKAKYSPDIIFDIAFSTTLSQSIKKFAEDKKIIIASIHSDTQPHSDWEFFIHNSWKSQIEALYGIISYFNWQKFIVISDDISNKNSEIFSNYFKDKDYRWYFFSNGNNENSANLFIGKVIQPIGIRNIVLLNQGESAKLLLKALEEKNLLINGTGIIVGSEGSWGLNGNWIIGYVESGLESADSYYSYQGLAFIKYLKIILNLDFSSDLSLFQKLNNYFGRETEIRSPTFPGLSLNSSCYGISSLKADCVPSNLFAVDNHPISNFTLLNTKNNQKIISGNIFEGNLTILAPLSFPGDSLIIPNSPFTYINIWYDNGLGLWAGILYTLIYWKSLHFLEGFEISSTELLCSGNTYHQNLCFSHALSTPAVGFITSPFSSESISFIYTLRSLNCSIPNVSPYSPSDTLRNKAEFPEFMTITKDIKFNAKVMIDLAVVFRWQNFIVLYDDANDLDCQYFISLIEQFNMKTATKFNIKIANSPDMRKMNTTYTVDKFSQWKGWFESLISLNVRLYVIFLNIPSWWHVVESFYDAGLRRGDAIFLSNGRVAYSLTWETDTSQISKLIELLYGSVVVFHAEWFGEYGKKLENGYLK